MDGDPHMSWGIYKTWASFPMSTRAQASKKMGDAHHLSILASFLFLEHLAGGVIPGGISGELLGREATLSEHLLCARYCGMLSTFIISLRQQPQWLGMNQVLWIAQSQENPRTALREWLEECMWS